MSHQNRRKARSAKYWWTYCMRCDGAAVSDNQRKCPRCGHVHSFTVTHDKKPAPDVEEWNEILIDRG